MDGLLEVRGNRPSSMRWLVGIVVWVITLSLAAAAYAERVTLEHAVNSGHGQAYIDATMAIAEMFNNAQDEIYVEVTVLTNYDETVITRAAGGAMPDTLTSNRYGDLAGRGLLLPMDSFLERDGLESVFVPASLEHGRWDGELVQLPLFAQPAVTYYNTWLFESAGVDDPNELAARGAWDWEALLDVGRKIARDTTGDGIPDIYGTGGTWVSMERMVFWIGLSGGYYFDRYTKATESRFNTPEVERALTFVHSLAHEHRITDVTGLTNMPVSKFTNGEAGVMLDGPWRIAGIRGAGMSDEAWDVAPMLAGPAGRPGFIHVDGAQISRLTRHPELAWRWLRFLATDPGATEALMRMVNRPPAYIPTLMGYTDMIQVDGHPRHAETFWNKLITPGEAIPISPLVPNTNQFFRVHSAEIGKFLRNEQSVTATMEILDRAFTQILSAAN